MGQPNQLIDGLIEQGAKDLTIALNNAGVGRIGVARLMDLKRVRKVICSFPRSSDPVVFETLYKAGEIELETDPARHARGTHPRGRGRRSRILHGGPRSARASPWARKPVSSTGAPT